MRKEAVRLNLDGVTSELPYRDYYRSRNGLVAKYLARYLDLPYFDETGRGVNEYVVPPVAITKKDAEKLGIRAEADFYGGAVDRLGHVSKAILHPCISLYKPPFHSDWFARSIVDLVVPGVTTFLKHALLDNYEELVRQFPVMRLKLSNKSDGHGQYLVSSRGQLIQVLETIADEEVRRDGLIVEDNLERNRTISVGRVVVGSDIFYTLARQKNDLAPEDNRNRYLGAEVFIVRDNIGELLRASLSSTEQTALSVASKFLERYSYFDPVCSRISFDYLVGYHTYGERVAGITDITARLGGTCPALCLAVLEFKSNPGLSLVRAEVNLNYDPSDEKAEEEGAVRFIDLPSLRLTARVNSVKQCEK